MWGIGAQQQRGGILPIDAHTWAQVCLRGSCADENNFSSRWFATRVMAVLLEGKDSYQLACLGNFL